MNTLKRATSLIWKRPQEEFKFENDILMYKTINELGHEKYIDVLKFYNCTFSKDQSFERLAEILSKLKLSELELDEINISSEQLLSVIRAIKNSDNLNKLTLCDLNVQTSHLKLLKELKTKKLQFLDLSFNDFEDTNAENINNILLKNPLLEQLYLSNNNLSAKGFSQLKGLKSLNKLKELDLRSNQLKFDKNNSYFLHAFSILANLHSLQELDLSNNNLTDDDIENIYMALMPNKLVILELENNKIGNKGAGKLSELSVSELNLKHNQISGVGMSKLITALDNKNIEYVNLAENLIKKNMVDLVKLGKVPNICLDNQKCHDFRIIEEVYDADISETNDELSMHQLSYSDSENNMIMTLIDPISSEGEF